jgi:hypothetical protein
MLDHDSPRFAEEDAPRERNLVVSFGGGVNSAAMLIGMREHGIKPKFILFADTGAEKPETYAFIDQMRTWTVRNMDLGIVALSNDGMYGDLENECLKKHTLPSLVFGWRSCSDKYKLRPQKQFVERALKGAPVTWAVGIDAGERHRMGAFENCWHPLVEWSWYRADCIKAIERAGLPIPVKSACFFCPASTKAEVLALKRKHPDLFQRAVEMEHNATRAHTAKGLGRHWSWEELAENHDKQGALFPETAQIPCMCFDGEETCDAGPR